MRLDAIVLALGFVASCLGCGASETAPSPVTAPTPPSASRYALCSANVAATDLVPQANGMMSLFVSLTPEATEDFAAFSEAHLGRTVAIDYGGNVLVETNVSAPIRSGVVGGPYETRQQAEDAQVAIHALPPTPCGAL